MVIWRLLPCNAKTAAEQIRVKLAYAEALAGTQDSPGDPVTADGKK